ncbi:MAG: peptidoglycan-binding domain-containing protein [Thermoleophilia bacterium]
MEFEIIQNCPVPAELADELRAIFADSGAKLNSCDRSPEAEPILKQCGKHSQRELFELHAKDPAHWNPANRPGQSTHERRNDGVAYPGNVGDQLEYWQVGIDVNNLQTVIQAAGKRGWIVTTTYPGSKQEAQHLNFRKEPERKDPTLQFSNEGPNVKRMAGILAAIRSPVDKQHYLPEAFPHFGPQVKAAVEKFQKDHHQKVDGVCGDQTWTQLHVALRAHKADPENR